MVLDTVYLVNMAIFSCCGLPDFVRWLMSDGFVRQSKHNFLHGYVRVRYSTTVYGTSVCTSTNHEQYFSGYSCSKRLSWLDCFVQCTLPTFYLKYNATDYGKMVLLLKLLRFILSNFSYMQCIRFIRGSYPHRLDYFTLF